MRRLGPFGSPAGRLRRSALDLLMAMRVAVVDDRDEGVAARGLAFVDRCDRQVLGADPGPAVGSDEEGGGAATVASGAYARFEQESAAMARGGAFTRHRAQRMVRTVSTTASTAPGEDEPASTSPKA